MSNLKSESAIQAQILKLLKEKGAYSVKVISANQNGIPDILFCLDGKFAAIEVKRQKPNGKMLELTELQKRNVRLIKESGGIAFAACSVADVERELNYSLHVEKQLVKQAFISGMVTGLDRKQVLEKFSRSEYILRKKGYTPWSPVRHIHPHTSWRGSMLKCIPALCASELVYFQADWKKSKGAKIEHWLAKILGKERFYEEADLAAASEKARNAVGL